MNISLNIMKQTDQSDINYVKNKQFLLYKSFLKIKVQNKILKNDYFL